MLASSVIVIGNGESRTNINIKKLTECYTTVACNAFHRDHTPSSLVCCDRDTALEALKNLKIQGSRILVREEFCENNRNRFPDHRLEAVPPLPFPSKQRQDEPEHWGSGTYAVLHSCYLHSKSVYLLGFDLYGRNGCVNNCYKGTEFYSPADSHAVDPSYWIYQIARVFEYFPIKDFFVVNDISWRMPEEWSLPNVTFWDTDYFNRHVAC